MKHRLCNECYAATGHAEWCVSKGYAGVGPHPDAPPDTSRAPIRTTPPAQCPCGIARTDCEYHAVAAAPSYEVYDYITFNGQHIWEMSAPSHWCNSPACPTCRIAT